jgi:hypothetical protein
MGNTTTNNTTSTTVEDVYEEDITVTQEEPTTRVAYDSEETQSSRIGILDEIEDREIARWGHT